MEVRVRGGVALLALVLGACSPSTAAAPAADDLRPAVEGANEVLPWAFVLNDPAPAGAEKPDPDEVVTVPGSSLQLRRGDITSANGPPDWHPEGHPPMPDVVADGNGKDVLPCGYCHLPNGQGKPENGPVAGQPYAYLLQQIEDFKKGLRKSGEPRMGPPNLMMGIGAAVNEEDARAAAAYFSSLHFKPWIRVVETDSVPVTRHAAWIHQVVEGGGKEPIGNRVVEVPQDLRRTELRDDASGFIAYVPNGAVERGEVLATTGGDGRTVACTTCHGPDLRGLGPVPALAGRSPSYLARQLYDFRQKNRAGLWSPLMQQAVAKLSVQDVVDLVAYAASLKP